MDERVERGISWRVVLTAVCLTVGLAGPEEVWSSGGARADAVSAATRAGASVVGLVGSDYEELEEPVPRDVELSEDQVVDMVRKAVDLAGGLWNRIDLDADWVVIKPNIVNLEKRGSGAITDWRVVKGVVELVHEVVPRARISIAEGSGGWIPPGRKIAGRLGPGVEWGDGFEVAGFWNLLRDPDLEGVDLELVDLNFDEAVEVEVPGGGSARDRYFVPETVLECDFLIGVSVLKVTGVVGFTNVLKNFVGIAPGMVYGWPKMRGYPPGKRPGIPHSDKVLDEMIVDLFALSGIDFAVVDAIVGMERDRIAGRFGRGSPVRLNAILAGADPVAVDAVSADLIGLNPDDIEYLTLAERKGLGTCDLSRIEVRGSRVEQVGRRFEKSPTERGHYGQGCRIWLLKGPFPYGEEEPADPADPRAMPGENGWVGPVYFGDDKIDLDGYFGDPVDCVVYAYTEFTAPRGQEADLWLGSDEGLRVWLNGEKVYDHEGRRPHRLPNDRVRVRIQKGRNAVLVRASQTRGRFDFSLNVCEPEKDRRYDGNRVRGVRFWPPGGKGVEWKKRGRRHQ